nr:hypothetical protein [Tanacetum cinerariifolium]
MSHKDVIRFLKYVSRCREVEVYIKTGVSLVERHTMKQMTSKGKGVVIEEIVDHDFNDVVGKDFDGESGNSGKLSLLECNQSCQVGNSGTIVDNDFCVFDSENDFPPPWSVKIMIANRTKRLSDEFKFKKLFIEIDHVFRLENSSQDSLELPNDVDFEEGMEELLYYDTYDGASISGKEGDLKTWFVDEEIDQDIDVEWQDDTYHFVDEPEVPKEIHNTDVVPVNVVAEEMVIKEAVDGDEDEHVVYDGDVIQDELYATIGVGPVDDWDVIPNEVVAEEMLEDLLGIKKRLEHVIAARANNRPPMLDKSQYNSWKSHMLLYIKGKENGKQLHDSANNRPFQYGTIEIPATLTTLACTRDRTYKDLTEAEKILTKEIWDRVKLLIEGSELSLQEEELKFYNEFDTFTLEKRETIHSYYLRFAQLINDMNMIGIGARVNATDTGVNKNVETNTANQAKIDDLDAFDSDYDEAPSSSVVLMAKLSAYDSNVLSENKLEPPLDSTLDYAYEFVNKPVVENCKAKSSEDEPKVDCYYHQKQFQNQKMVKPVWNNAHMGNPQIDLQDQGVIDSGCSRHMTENMSYLTDYKEINREYVAFGGNPKEGKIIGKCNIKNEIVNTACYVQNKVLVVKPYNKTLYELFHGRTPTLSFMRPFGCPVTILNTIDHFGKFNGNADEDFFVGYSLNSKASRVFNSRTRIVEANLHIKFSESIPNVVGSGPDWLFDIDALTRTMNYEPIVACTQSNGFAGTKASDNAGQARKETEHVKDYILLPLWTADPSFSQDPKSSNDDGSKPSSDDGKKVDEDPRKENE